MCVCVCVYIYIYIDIDLSKVSIFILVPQGLVRYKPFNNNHYSKLGNKT